MTTVGITGHQNIPPMAISFVRKGLADLLERFGSQLVGLSSLAAGADQLFAQIVLQMGGSLQVVIPCSQYETTFAEEPAKSRFRQLLCRAATTETLRYEAPSEKAFSAAGKRIVDLADTVIAVWDGKEARGEGGTGDIVRYARDRGVEVLIVWPPGFIRA